MKAFNPEKELYKIQKGNRNKAIFGVIALLIIIAIGSSYALYQIRYNKRIIYTTVAPFYSKDLQLAVYVDGIKQDNFPEKSDDMLYGGYECERDSKITFNRDKWNITLETNHPDKCNIRFGTKYEDESGANYPELYQGMIPVYFKEGKIYIADVTSEWYNYDNNEWANAVLIDYENNKSKFYDDNNNLLGGHEVSEEDILQMYVWIPRYKYQLFNANNEEVEKQIINIQFEEGISNTGNIKCTYTNNNDGTITEDCKDKTTQASVKNTDWYTHPAFTFKGTTETTGTELKGFWVGKFEPSDSQDEIGRNENKIGEITILPNKTSTVNKSVSTAFYAEQKISEEGNKYNLDSNIIDTRIMKNIEWGAVAYLSQSIYGIYKDENACNITEMTKENCKIWVNNTVQGVSEKYGGTYTGCVGDSSNAYIKWNTEENTPAKCKDGNKWNQGGIKASTTGNMYGIYDMNEGTYEYVSGVLVNKMGEGLCLGSSGFQEIDLQDIKYYDIYTFGSDGMDYKRGHLGDATREIIQTFERSNGGGWNNSYTTFPLVTPNVQYSWFLRGVAYDHGGYGSIFAFRSIYAGNARLAASFRSVLSAA